MQGQSKHVASRSLTFCFDWMLEAFWAIIVAPFLLVHFEDADSSTVLQQYHDSQDFSGDFFISVQIVLRVLSGIWTVMLIRSSAQIGSLILFRAHTEAWAAA